uniref:Uncharacterized protein n=1 Tax=Amphimedon queenslandica TaxID=400682 RepID=A0A1X7VIU7_AMPQE
MDKPENSYDVPTFELQPCDLKPQSQPDVIDVQQGNKAKEKSRCKMFLLFFVLLVLILLIQVALLVLVLLEKKAVDSTTANFLDDERCKNCNGTFLNYAIFDDQQLYFDKSLNSSAELIVEKLSSYHFETHSLAANIMNIMYNLSNEQLLGLQNNTEILKNVIVSSKSREFASIFTSLLNLENGMNSSAGVMNDVSILVKNLLELRNETTSLATKTALKVEEIFNLGNEQLLGVQNSTEILKNVIVSSKSQEFASIFTSLSNLENGMNSSAGVMNDVSILVKNLLELRNETTSLATKTALKVEEIFNLGNEQLLGVQNSTEILKNVIVSSKSQEFASIFTSLSNLENGIDSSAGVIDNVLVLVKNLLEVHNETSYSLPLSCEQIKNKYPNTPSGYYIIGNSSVYCHMGTLCNSTGG